VSDVSDAAGDANPSPPPGARRPSRLQVLLLSGVLLVGVAAGATAFALRLSSSSTTGGTPDVALVATTPASVAAALEVGDVLLTGGGASVPLLRTARPTSTAPSLADLGAYSVPAGHYTRVSATVGGSLRTARLDVTVRSGQLTPILLVVRPDSITAAAGNDEVNHAVLAAAGQLIHPPDVTFVDQNGANVPLSSLHGKVLVAAALDSHCHDTCPLYTALWSDLQHVIRERGWGDRVALAEISMDPERDTPQELAAYARLTGASWPLLRADVATTFQFWLSLHASYRKAPPSTPVPTDWYTGQAETYHLDHDSVAVIFDQNGDARYTLQGNPRLGHALPQALGALLNPEKAQSIQQTAAWSITDVLDRIDTVLGLPTESDRGTEQAARTGARAPDFTLPALDGTSLSLRAQTGRPTIVTFWATWCAPCRKDFPALAAAVKSHPDLIVLAVDEGEDAGQVRDFISSVLGADASRLIPLLDADHSVGARYAASGLPVTVFIGADGIVQAVRIGQLHDSDLTTALAATGA
jgi:cytochrome oxidase Cu insertion factor (SCO1/SenC/PrrC family)